MFDRFSIDFRRLGGLQEHWRATGGALEGWRRIGEGSEEGWRRIGEGLGEDWRRIGGLEEGWRSAGRRLARRYGLVMPQYGDYVPTSKKPLDSGKIMFFLQIVHLGTQIGCK